MLLILFLKLRYNWDMTFFLAFWVFLFGLFLKFFKIFIQLQLSASSPHPSTPPQPTKIWLLIINWSNSLLFIQSNDRKNVLGDYYIQKSEVNDSNVIRDGKKNLEYPVTRYLHYHEMRMCYLKIELDYF